MDDLQPRHQTTNIMTIFASSAQTSASCALKTGSLNAEEAKVDTEVAEVRPWTKTTKLKFILAMAGLLGGLMTGWGATTNVSFGAYFFNPKSVTIKVGDTVSWNGSFHTVTVTNRAAAEQFCGGGAVIMDNCSHTFLVPGTYNYICTLPGHAGFGMTGTVIVQGGVANNPPSVSITNPVANQVFAVPANITVEVAASDSDGSVTNVQLFSGGTMVGALTHPPYSLTLSNVPNGSYTLTAKATDNSGATTTSAVIAVTVTTIRLTPGGSTNGQFQFHVAGLVVGKTNLIQASLGISNWISIQTNKAAENNLNFIDPDSTSPGHRIYRVLELP